MVNRAAFVKVPGLKKENKKFAWILSGILILLNYQLFFFRSVISWMIP